MPGDWKTIPLDAGMFVALVTGVASVVLAVYGIQLWVDARIDAAVDPVENRIEQVADRTGDLEEWRYTRQERVVDLLHQINDRLEDENARVP